MEKKENKVETIYYHIYKCKLCGEIFMNEVSSGGYGQRFMTLHDCNGLPFENMQGSSGEIIARFKCNTIEEAQDRLNFIKYFNINK